MRDVIIEQPLSTNWDWGRPNTNWDRGQGRSWRPGTGPGPGAGKHKYLFFTSIKETNRLLSKGISNIFLKVTIEKN